MPLHTHQISTLKLFVISIGIVVIYFASAKLGLLLVFVQANASPVWPPTGIALAAMMIFGLRIWPSIFIASFAVAMTTNISVFAAIGIATGNTLEAVVDAYLI